MKKSEMIKEALNHQLNTVCVNEAQVESMLEIFEKLGMLPPCKYDKAEDCMFCYGEHIYIWESEDEKK